MNVTSVETWMNFNQVLQTEDTMKIVSICFKFVNVCKFLLSIASFIYLYFTLYFPCSVGIQKSILKESRLF